MPFPALENMQIVHNFEDDFSSAQGSTAYLASSPRPISFFMLHTEKLVSNVTCPAALSRDIGKTGRSANTRLKEHKAACKLANFDRSAVAEYAWKDGHVIEWDQVDILDTSTDERQRRVKESHLHQDAPPPRNEDQQR